MLGVQSIASSRSLNYLIVNPVNDTVAGIVHVYSENMTKKSLCDFEIR